MLVYKNMSDSKWNKLVVSGKISLLKRVSLETIHWRYCEALHEIGPCLSLIRSRATSSLSPATCGLQNLGSANNAWSHNNNR